LNSENLTPEVIWEKVRSKLQSNREACVIFDEGTRQKILLENRTCPPLI
jgi:hypothetical protein